MVQVCCGYIFSDYRKVLSKMMHNKWSLRVYGNVIKTIYNKRKYSTSLSLVSHHANNPGHKQKLMNQLKFDNHTSFPPQPFHNNQKWYNDGLQTWFRLSLGWVVRSQSSMRREYSISMWLWALHSHILFRKTGRCTNLSVQLWPLTGMFRAFEYMV